MAIRRSEWPKTSRLFRCCGGLIGEGSFHEPIFSMFGKFLEHVVLDGKIELLNKRTIVGGCNNSQAFQRGCIQHVMFVAPSQGRSPLLLRTPLVYEYRKLSSLVKRRPSQKRFPHQRHETFGTIGICAIM